MKILFLLVYSAFSSSVLNAIFAERICNIGVTAYGIGFIFMKIIMPGKRLKLRQQKGLTSSADLSALLCVMLSCVFVTFSSVSILDLCFFIFFHYMDQYTFWCQRAAKSQACLRITQTRQRHR